MPLPRLVPGSGTVPVPVQDTTLSLDVLGRHIASTWEEATANGGGPFSVVIVGAGMYGAYLAARLYRERPGARILLLDAGPFLVPEHVQNLGAIGLDVPAPVPPASDTGVARAAVWGLPWRGNVEFPGLAYCTGGKSVYWGGWCPRLTAGDLALWPAATAQALTDAYTIVESETGVQPATDFITGDLYDALFDRAVAVAPGVPGVETAVGTGGVQPAPVAVQGAAPASGLFSFDKFSAVPVLTQAIREDVAASGLSDADRRLFLVTRAHVVSAQAGGGRVQSLVVEAGGQRHTLPLGPAGNLVLAASGVESTRLALQSFPSPLMGRNLMAHLRSDFTVRIRRSALPPLPGHVQTAALLVRGLAPTGRFHLQVTASTSRAGSDDLLFRMIPDVDLVGAHLANTDPEWVTLTVRGLGEMHGDRLTPVPNDGASWINLSPFEIDEFGVPRAWVNLQLSADDNLTWQAMDVAAVSLARAVAGAEADIEYLWDGAWRAEPFPLSRPFPPWHNGLGTTYHESGTLWMGDDPATSVTDPIGRFHHLANAYACDQSVFPTVGSVNPVLTGLALAHHLAGALPL